MSEANCKLLTTQYQTAFPSDVFSISTLIRGISTIFQAELGVSIDLVTFVHFSCNDDTKHIVQRQEWKYMARGL
jgi:hypothetical protein